MHITQPPDPHSEVIKLNTHNPAIAPCVAIPVSMQAKEYTRVFIHGMTRYTAHCTHAYKQDSDQSVGCINVC